mmetsp:Transcript_2502/g.9823  ORF Transcript_2502/g.9823 Transcript_2502/m.9823 type:complete len:205 (+) Transcript_2502:114-728(+)
MNGFAFSRKRTSMSGSSFTAASFAWPQAITASSEKTSASYSSLSVCAAALKKRTPPVRFTNGLADNAKASILSMALIWSERFLRSASRSSPFVLRCLPSAARSSLSVPVTSAGCGDARPAGRPAGAGMQNDSTAVVANAPVSLAERPLDSASLSNDSASAASSRSLSWKPSIATSTSRWYSICSLSASASAPGPSAARRRVRME